MMRANWKTENQEEVPVVTEDGQVEENGQVDNELPEQAPVEMSPEI